MKLVLTSALLGALFLISGCATQCEGIAAQYNTCTFEEGPRHRTVQVDGANFCGMVDALNTRAAAAGTTGCADLWRTHLQCWQGNMANICNIDDVTCDDSAIAWETCVEGYCATVNADPDGYDPQCVGGFSFLGFDNLSLPSPFQSGF